MQPLMRYDGYYVLADWIEIPNLREPVQSFPQDLMLEHCWAVRSNPNVHGADRRILFVAYAVVRHYRWWFTYSILSSMDTFLKPYKLDVIITCSPRPSRSMIGWPIWDWQRICTNVGGSLT